MLFKMSIPPKLPPIPVPDSAAQQAAMERHARLAKPGNALGQLEVLSVRLAGMTGNLNWRPQAPAVVICAGDHGIVQQNVSTIARGATKQLLLNILNGGAAINALARSYNAAVTVVDVGVAGIIPTHSHLVSEKINYGTADFTEGLAMSPGQVDKAIQLGMRVANAQIDAGADILFAGELGTGNTTSAAAITAAITGASVERVTGRGAGINSDQLQRKINVIETALAKHAPVDEDMLAKLGGFDIAALVGMMMAGAARRIPVVLDGYPSAAAALLAARMEPAVVHYLVAGQRSVEMGHGIALQTLGLTPVLALSMRAGEGAGALLALPLIDAAMMLLQEMATLEETGLEGML
ncbi:MAG: nicotinate-nucleotide--dimethylbenzimidazole phosphoribosyltransferase [Chloroflexota bacterium]